MARTYQKSEAQWTKQYYEKYLPKWIRAQSGTKYKEYKGYVEQKYLTIEEFKVYYEIAKNTLLEEGKSVANIYKELIEVGPKDTSPYKLSKGSAKALQKKLNEQENEKIKNKIIKSKEKHYYTIKELRVQGGRLSSDLNNILKEEHPDWTGKKRAAYIGEELYGSP